MDPSATLERERTDEKTTDLEDDGLEPQGEGQGEGGQQPPTDLGDQPPTPPANLPDDGGDNGDDDEREQLRMPGFRKLGMKVGGRQPDASVLKLKGTKIDIDGQFDRGDRFLAVTTLQVTGDNDQDTIDTLTGDVKSTSKAQSATVCGITRMEHYLAARIEDKALLAAVFTALELDHDEIES